MTIKGKFVSKRLQLSIAQGAVFTLGVYHMLLGLIMIVVPTWFYDNIGGTISTAPPYNQHYIGDFGAYQLPLGIALIIASRHPFRQRLLIGAVIIGNIIHALNHVYDDLNNDIPLSGVTISLLALGFVYLTLVFFNPPVQEDM